MVRLTLEHMAREAALAGCLTTFLDLSHRSFTDVSPSLSSASAASG